MSAEMKSPLASQFSGSVQRANASRPAKNPSALRAGARAARPGHVPGLRAERADARSPGHEDLPPPDHLWHLVPRRRLGAGHLAGRERAARMNVTREQPCRRPGSELLLACGSDGEPVREWCVVCRGKLLA